MNNKIAKFLGIFMLGVMVLGVQVIYYPLPELKPHEEIQYGESFHSRIDPTFFEYDQALKVAKANNR